MMPVHAGSVQITGLCIGHELARDVIGEMGQHVQQRVCGRLPPPAVAQARHDLARAKIIAFTSRQEEVYRRYPQTDTSLAARYARAILAHRFSRGGEAQAPSNRPSSATAMRRFMA